MDVAASILVGVVSALAIILTSSSMYAQYGLDPAATPSPLGQPGIITIPLSFITLVVFSLLFPSKNSKPLA